MVVNDNSYMQIPGSVLRFFASKLAPTGSGEWGAQKLQGEPKLPKK
jgi:hypothetical protein